MIRIGIVDYGLGNVGSLINILEDYSCEVLLTNQPKELKVCDKIILSGVGSYNLGMINLRRLKLDSFIKEYISKENKKLLGICLGFQLLGKNSEEGDESGLNIFPFEFKRFSESVVKVPHIGWNYVDMPIEKSPNFKNVYYFVHSYLAKWNPDLEYRNIGITYYGTPFISFIQTKNIMGCQFHPEKSGIAGKELLERFLKW